MLGCPRRRAKSQKGKTHHPFWVFTKLSTSKTGCTPFGTVAITLLFEISDIVIQKLIGYRTGVGGIENHRADKSSHVSVKSYTSATVR